jgi:hypothetical protein
MMTYFVVLDADGKNVIVRLDASNENSAHEIAKRLVKHHAHLAAQSVEAKPKEK